MELPPPPPSPLGEPAPAPAPGPFGRRTKTGLIALLVVLALVVTAVAVVVSQRGSGEQRAADDPSIGSSSPSVVPPSPPASVKAVPASFKVVMTWTPSTGEIAGYRVYRDGHVLAEVNPDVLRYVDDTVAPNSRYRYQVAAFTEAGVPTDRTDASVKTPPASLALARVEGTFNAKLHMTSSYGVSFSGSGGPGTLGLRMTPACAAGPCNVTLGVVNGKIERFTLKQAAAAYSGTGTDRAAFTCGGTPTSASFAVSFTVAAAKPLKDEWRASKLEGTILIRSASQLGCLASGIDYSFTAALYPG